MEPNSPAKLAEVSTALIDQLKVGRGRYLAVHGRSCRKAKSTEDLTKGVVIVGVVVRRDHQIL